MGLSTIAALSRGCIRMIDSDALAVPSSQTAFCDDDRLAAVYTLPLVPMSVQLTKKVVVSNIEVVDSVIGEAWCWGLAVLLSLEDQGEELFDSGHGNVAAVVA